MTEETNTGRRIDEDQLIEYFNDWVMECDADEAVFNMLQVAYERANCFDDMVPFLEAAELMDEFEDYVDDMLG